MAEGYPKFLPRLDRCPNLIKSPFFSARIVQDRLSFSSVKRKITAWSDENGKRRRTLGLEVIGSLIADVAVKKMAEDQGEGFEVSVEEIAMELAESWFDIKKFSQKKEVAFDSLVQTSGLQEFGESFGYKISRSFALDPALTFTPVS